MQQQKTQEAPASDAKYVSPHELKRLSKKMRAQARTKQEKDPGFLKQLWAGIASRLQQAVQGHVHQAPVERHTPEMKRTVKKVQPGKHRRQPVVPWR